MDERGRLLCLALLHIRRKRRNLGASTEPPTRKRKCEELNHKPPKRIWALEANQLRVTDGAFTNLFHDLRTDGNRFYEYFRMSITTFDELLYRIGAQIQKQDSNMRVSIPPAERLAVTLRYLLQGTTNKELQREFRMGQSTIKTITTEVCDAILHSFSQTCIPPPTVEKFESVAAEFEKKTQFPHCIGAIGMKCFRMTNAFVYLSLVAVADSDYRLLFVEIGSHGRTCNSSLFKETQLWESIVNNTLPFPEPKPLSASINKCVPYVFLGNEGFNIHANIMCPFIGNCLTEQKKIFNNRLSEARRYVDGAFGILSNKCGILHRPFHVNADMAMKVIKTCCVLHNFVMERQGFNLEDALTATDLKDVRKGNCTGDREGAETRRIFTNYFMSEGCVPCQ